MFFNLFNNNNNNNQNTHNNKIGYEDVLFSIEKTPKHLLINTLESHLQNCLIKTTLSIDNETNVLNQIIDKGQFKEVFIIIYGCNSVDATVDTKYKQLIDLGFPNVYIYSGGMFEWLLLQDIYGQDNFPTTSCDLDILKYKPRGKFNIPLLEI